MPSILEAPKRWHKWRSLTTAIYYSFGALFSWLLISNIPYAEIANKSIELVNKITPAVVLQPVLFVMYWCWLIGTKIDLKLQEIVYKSDREQGKISGKTYLAVLFLSVFALALFLTRENPRYFAAALTLFSLWSLLMQRLGIKTETNLICASRYIYENHELQVKNEQLRIVEHYRMGDWVWTRQRTLIALLIVVNLVCWLDTIPQIIARWIQRSQSEIKHEAVAVLLPLCSIILFLFVAESWQWYMRIKTRLSVFALGLLDNNVSQEGSNKDARSWKWLSGKRASIKSLLFHLRRYIGSIVTKTQIYVRHRRIRTPKRKRPRRARRTD